MGRNPEPYLHFAVFPGVGLGDDWMVWRASLEKLAAGTPHPTNTTAPPPPISFDDPKGERSHTPQKDNTEAMEFKDFDTFFGYVF